ncbi:MAG: retropepsin-like aspartic protease [Terracidiphilus sp.]|jgi:predicted aspartyl protease
MRISAAFLIVLGNFVGCLHAQEGDAQLKLLYDAHRWFLLRYVVARTNAPLFYKAAVEAAFNQQPQAERDLNAVISSKSEPETAHEARELLIGIYYRAGMYHEAFEQAKAILKKKPDADDIRNILPTLKVLSSAHDQTVASEEPVPVTMEIVDQNLILPVTVNGIQAHYIFDNGFSLSALSESEAMRLGLKIHDVKTHIDTMSGAQVGIRVAVAKDLEVAGVHLRDVAFYVLPKNQPPLNQLADGRQGILGLPVIFALRRFQWNAAEHGFTVLPPTSEPHKFAPNLAFESTSIFTELGFHGKSLDFSLDTGAQGTELYPAFAREFPEIKATGAPEGRKLTGVGGSAKMESVVVPSLAFIAGGREVVLKPAHILLKDNNSNSNWFDGNLGMDLLNQAHSVEVDFDAMTMLLR